MEVVASNQSNKKRGPLAYLLENKLFSDITFVSGSGKEVPSHRAVLGTIPFLHDLLTLPDKSSVARGDDKAKQKPLKLPLSDVSFTTLLRYAYQEQSQLSSVTTSDLLTATAELAVMKSRELLEDVWNEVEKRFGDTSKIPADMLQRYIEVAAGVLLKHHQTLALNRIGSFVPWMCVRKLSKEGIIYLIKHVGGELQLIWLLSWAACRSDLNAEDMSTLIGLLDKHAVLPSNTTLASIVSHAQNVHVTRYIVSKLLRREIALVPVGINDPSAVVELDVEESDSGICIVSADNEVATFSVKNSNPPPVFSAIRALNEDLKVSPVAEEPPMDAGENGEEVEEGEGELDEVLETGEDEEEVADVENDEEEAKEPTPPAPTPTPAPTPAPVPVSAPVVEPIEKKTRKNKH